MEARTLGRRLPRRARSATMAPSRVALFAVSILAVDCAPADPSATGDGVGDREIATTTQALNSNEATALGFAGMAFGEPAVAAFRRSSDQWWSTVVASNQFGGAPANHATGCSSYPYSIWCKWNQTLFGIQPAGDKSLVFDGSLLHLIQINTFGGSGAGIAHSWSSDPCPAGCATPVWGSCAEGGTLPLDYPQATVAAGTVYVTAHGGGGPKGQLYVIKLGPTGTCPSATVYQNFCDPSVNTAYAEAAVGTDGFLHIVYLHEGSLIRTIKFNLANPGFWCSTRRTIGPVSPPIATCDIPGSCDAVPPNPPPPTYWGVQNKCLKDVNGGGTIAIDTSVSPNTLIVAYTTDQPPQSTCPGKSETRFYRSTDNGNSWPTLIATGCQTSLQAKVKWASTPYVGALTGRFQATSIYDAEQNNAFNPGFRQVRWRTTDGGLSWSGAFISNERAMVPGTGGCWWGDYIGIVPDRINSAFFHAWHDSNITPPNDWVIRGRAVDE